MISLSTLWLTLLSCSLADPAPQVPVAVEPAAFPFAGTAFRSDTWCLEVHADGSIVLWDRDPSNPKVGIYGKSATATGSSTSLVYRFEVERVERHRWVSSCRKRVASAAELDRYVIGEAEAVVGEVFELRLVDPAGQPQLCIRERCIAVKSEPLSP